MAQRMSSRSRTRLLQAVIPAYLVLCVMFGGSGIVGPFANALLQILAIPLLWFAVMTRMDVPLTATGRQLVLLVVLIGLVFAIQLVPLPGGLWSGLPGRKSIVEGYRLLGMPLPAMPISLMPNRTLAALLWLLPPLAVLLGMLRLGGFNIRLLVWCLGAVSCVSVLLGAVQLAGGEASPAYLYERNSVGVATGFFTNPNHFGTLMLMVVPLLAAVLAAEFDRRRNHKQTSAIIMVAVAMLALLLVGIVITRSLAAIGLSVPVAAASFFIVRWRHKRVPIWVLPLVGIATAAALVTSVVEPFDNDLTSSSARTEQLSRYTKYVRTLDAIGDFMPMGSGIGTMPFVYHLYENPTETIRTYASHTHSDPLEVVLDAGLPGLLLLVLFAVGWSWRTIAIWRSPDTDGFTRAATIASAAAMAHSFVDYPLRSTADAAVFVAMLALMAGARERRVAGSRETSGSVRHLVA